MDETEVLISFFVFSCQFSEARSNLRDLISEYQQYQEYSGDYEEVARTIWKCHKGDRTKYTRSIEEVDVQIPEKIVGMFPININISVKKWIKNRRQTSYIESLPTDVVQHMLKYVANISPPGGDKSNVDSERL